MDTTKLENLDCRNDSFFAGTSKVDQENNSDSKTASKRTLFYLKCVNEKTKRNNTIQVDTDIVPKLDLLRLDEKAKTRAPTI